MSTLTLRPYQQQTIDALNAQLAAGVNRPAAVLATGLGKTVVFSAMIAAFDPSPASRAMVLVHRDELAAQAVAKIRGVAPHLRVGVVKAGRNEVDADVIVASVQTVSRERRREPIRRVGLIVADECHHAAAPSWRTVLKHFGAWAGVPTIGVTATMSREDSRGLGEIWQTVVQRPGGGQYDTLWGIRHGYLADVRGIRVQVPRLDLSGVRTVAGDLQQDDVAAAMLNADTGGAIAKAIAEFAPDEQGMVFAPNVEAADDFTAAINDAGWAAALVIGTTPPEERARIYREFEQGKIRWLVNNLVLTEGFDAPWAKVAIVARPTKSRGLYQQMVGRVLRPWMSRGALVLDVVGTTTKHGLASIIDLSPDRAPKDRQSVLEAWDEFGDDEQFDPGPVPESGPVSRVVGQDVDLFAGVASRWLRTSGGTWFVPARDRLLFCWPDAEGTYFTAQLMTKGEHTPEPLLGGMTLELAMQWAEHYATEAGIVPESERIAPTDRADQNRAARARASWKPEWTAGQADDALALAIAERRLNP